ncbi:cupin domain-containing protein [Natrinema longum]|uniref:Cupin domain-containing protein n=1 Tax=Natrinema longum TaxID=370324 RepID=A0A8A2UBQ8_9EURY|nr:cupin domain-containing protein [Natrinema longum]MBZ6495900.1 cupin domain-containing protein [Natrinema longum]QSW86159.1 cupin domain-containing protein [Natrinema longum]
MPERTSLEDLEKAPHAEVFEERTPRTVRLQLTADERVPKHRHPESNVVLHVLSGAVEVTLGDDVYDLEPGDVVRFDGDQDVSPYAVEDSTALVVFAPKETGD